MAVNVSFYVSLKINAAALRGRLLVYRLSKGRSFFESIITFSGNPYHNSKLRIHYFNYCSLQEKFQGKINKKIRFYQKKCLLILRRHKDKMFYIGFWRLFNLILRYLSLQDEICKSIAYSGGIDIILQCIDDSGVLRDVDVARACCSLLSKVQTKTLVYMHAVSSTMRNITF